MAESRGNATVYNYGGSPASPRGCSEAPRRADSEEISPRLGAARRSAVDTFLCPWGGPASGSGGA
eukprot:3860540-Pyramimonas_sp.AAC.1